MFRLRAWNSPSRFSEKSIKNHICDVATKNTLLETSLTDKSMIYGIFRESDKKTVVKNCLQKLLQIALGQFSCAIQAIHFRLRAS